MQLVAAAESGWRSATPFLWVVLGNRQIVHGLPGDGLELTFHFPAGMEAYAKLISRPADPNCHVVSFCRFLSVQFVNRP